MLPLSRLTYDSDTWQYLFPGGADTLALLDAMRNGKRLRVEYTGDKGAATTNFSLSGLVGSLIFADEVQGRLEASDALQVKGNKQSRPPQIRDITTMSEIPKPIRAQFKAPDGTCSFSDETYLKDMGGFEADIGNGYKLWSLPCGDSAYNQDVVFFTALNKDYESLPLPDMGESGLTATRYAVNIDWDQPSKTLTSFNKGRGLGDCGEWDKWVLKSSEEGPAFVLIEARAKDCDDSNPSADDVEEPEKWPLVWPVRTK